MTTQNDIFFTSDRDFAAIEKQGLIHQEEPVEFAQHARAMGVSIATMLGAYLLWAQDFGNTGFAVFLIATSLLFVWNLSRDQIATVQYRRVLLIGFGLLLGCIRLVWQPNAIVCVAGIMQSLAIAMAMQGRQRGALRMVVFTIQSAGNGVLRWILFPWGGILNGMSRNRFAWLSWGLPLFAGVLFLIPLIQSHPELASEVARNLSSLIDATLKWAAQFNFVAVILVSMVGVWSLGVLLPNYWKEKTTHSSHTPRDTQAVCSQTVYLASRNTLIVVSCVFVWFLIIEIRATWFRDFPEGFIYSTYAHQGAAWLTVALGMSTIAMSILFHPQVHKHPRIATLQRLAWLWSICNVLLVIAVFYRLIIYVNFNGMTRMRIIGFVGVSCVFAGFIIVNSRIVHQKSMSWILNRQFWAFLWSIYLLALLPMDAISYRWNENRIRAGHLAPSVQIAVHTISDEGLLCLLPLLKSDEVEIRNGVAALFAERISRGPDSLLDSGRSIRWTQIQGARDLLAARLKEVHPQLKQYVLSTIERQAAMDRFRQWTRRWY